MSPAGARRVAWSIWASIVVIGLANAWLTVRHGLTSDYWGLTDSAVLITADAASGLVFALGGAMGLLVVMRQPSNPVGWLLLVSFLFWSAVFLVETVAIDARFVAPVNASAAGWAGLAWSLLGVLAIGLLLIMVWVFPTGRLLTHRWRTPFRLVVGLLVAAMAVHVLVPGPMADWAFEADPIDNPLGLGFLSAWSGATAEIEGLLLTPVLLLTLTSFVIRFRQSHGVERQQLKWLLYAVLVGTGGAMAWFALGDAWGILGELGFEILVPGSVAIAMSRYRLYDIDRLISRTLSYVLITTSLVVIYLGLVLGLGLVVRPLHLESDLAVAGSVLVVAALFNPIRRRAQALVDRRFNRARFDGEQRVTAFSERLREEVDLDVLTAELATVVGETMEPTIISVYLRAIDAPAPERPLARTATTSAKAYS